MSAHTRDIKEEYTYSLFQVGDKVVSVLGLFQTSKRHLGTWDVLCVSTIRYAKQSHGVGNHRRLDVECKGHD